MKTHVSAPKKKAYAHPEMVEFGTLEEITAVIEASLPWDPTDGSVLRDWSSLDVCMTTSDGIC